MTDDPLSVVGWLAGRGKIDRARQTLLKMNKGVPGYDIDTEMVRFFFSNSLQKNTCSTLNPLSSVLFHTVYRCFYD